MFAHLLILNLINIDLLIYIKINIKITTDG